MAKKLQGKFDDNRQAILKATTRLFAKKGVMGTSFSDIAKEVKPSKGTVSYYFPSKEHLVYEVNEFNLSDITSLVFKWLEELQEGDAAEQAIERLMEMLAGNGESLSLELCMMFECMQDVFGLKKRVVEKLYEWQTMIKIGLMKTGLSGRELERRTVLGCTLLESLIVRTALQLSPQPIEYIYDNTPGN